MRTHPIAYQKMLGVTGQKRTGKTERLEGAVMDRERRGEHDRQGGQIENNGRTRDNKGESGKQATERAKLLRSIDGKSSSS